MYGYPIEVLEEMMNQRYMPAIMRCLHAQCSSYQHEYAVWSEDQKRCPSCKIQGQWCRSITGKNITKYSCGMCLTTLLINENEWPMSHFGWGIIQLGQKQQLKFLCINCQMKLEKAYPNLKEDSVSKKIEPELPKIVQPSKFANANTG